MEADRRPPAAADAARQVLSGAVRRGAERLGVPAGASLVVAVSGGPDSMAMLHGALLVASDTGWRLGVAHLNHRLRPEADADASFVANAAAALGLPCSVGSSDVRDLARREHRSLEDAARRARYAFLEEVAEAQGGETLVLTGHTADDQAETVLLRLVRGSGLRGLRGIPPRRGRVVRPLLGERRATLRAALDAAGIAYRADRSNDDPAAADRNRVRLEVLPLLEALNPGAVDTLVRFARLAAEDDELLDTLAANELAERRADDGTIDWRRPPAPALGRRVLRLALGDPPPPAERIDALLAAAEGSRGGLRIELGGGRTAEIRGRRIRFE